MWLSHMPIANSTIYSWLWSLCMLSTIVWLTTVTATVCLWCQTFPAVAHNSASTSTKLYWLADLCNTEVMFTSVWTTCQRLSPERWTNESQTCDLESRVKDPTITPPSRDASFTRICDCRIFRILTHLSHILAKCAYRTFFPQFQYSMFFYLKQYS